MSLKPSMEGDKRRSQLEVAQNVHKKRISRIKDGYKKSKLKQGHRVDNIIRSVTKNYSNIKAENITCFNDFPLSKQTKQGLEEAKYITPTDIQRQSMGLALQGHDVLGAAKTGSGKTLAFLIPVLELLYRNKVGYLDGMSALIVSPTRELAYQTYSVVKKIGFKHDFSAGLVIGGKDLKEETERISRTHIVICTPGRLQQHMEQTWGFNADSLQILVLDECDRILDMGFEETMNAILEYLPSQRQTLMFSATQTKSVKELARVGLRSPHLVSVHEKSEYSTPTTLEQSYLVCDLHNKLNLLWFFIKNHLKSKILVFVQTSKQVRYIQEAFTRMRAGTTLLSLYGTMKQIKRVKTYESFCRKQNVVLFATDLAARGLDFPGVNWVVQFDAPDDADTYIHRVGRTARYDNDGEALLFLLPSEKKEMISKLKAKKIPIEEIEVNPKKMGDIQKKLSSQLVEDPQLKEFAKACFVSYIKGYFLMKDKAMFNVSKIETDSFAQSLGLVLTPRIRFLQKREKLEKERQLKKARELAKAQKMQPSSSESDSQSDDEDTNNSQSESDSEGASQSEKIKFVASDGEDDDDLFTVKKSMEDEKSDELNKLSLQEQLVRLSQQKNRPISKRDQAVLMKKKGLVSKRTTFSDDESSDEEGVLDLEAARRRLQEADNDDKQADRERVKRKHQERRWKAKMARRDAAKDEDTSEEEVLLASSVSDEDGSDADSTNTPLTHSKPVDNQSADTESSPSQSESEEFETTGLSSDEAESIKPSLADDEAFALQLLTSQK